MLWPSFGGFGSLRFVRRFTALLLLCLFAKGEAPAFARGSRPHKIYLIKNVSMLRATYQIGLLVFKAVDSHNKLMLKVSPIVSFSRFA